jgi:CBS domain-containing protein
MDGGRVLRALLAMKMDYLRATQKAASVGQGMALLFGLFGLFFNPFLIFIALFVWMGAAQEASMVQMKTALGGIPISMAMIREFHTLAPQEPLQRAVDLLLAGFQHDFPVVDNGQLVGVLTRAKLLKVLASQGQEASVADAMEKDFQTADPSEMIETVFARLQACECHSLPVIQSGQLRGILTMENIGEFLMLQSALRKTKA